MSYVQRTVGQLWPYVKIITVNELRYKQEKIMEAKF